MKICEISNVNFIGGKIMKELLFFIFGLITGGIIGSIVMCFLQVNKLDSYNNEKNIN